MDVEWTERARRDLVRLDRRTQERIVAAVVRFAETGQGDVKRLQGQRPDGADSRLRVGDWRVLFTVAGDALVMLVVRVRPRGQAYQRRR